MLTYMRDVGISRLLAATGCKQRLATIRRLASLIGAKLRNVWMPIQHVVPDAEDKVTYFESICKLGPSY